MLGAHSLEDDFPSNNKKLAYASNIDLLFTIKYSATLLYLKNCSSCVFEQVTLFHI